MLNNNFKIKFLKYKSHKFNLNNLKYFNKYYNNNDLLKNKVENLKIYLFNHTDSYIFSPSLNLSDFEY